MPYDNIEHSRTKKEPDETWVQFAEKIFAGDPEYFEGNYEAQVSVLKSMMNHMEKELK